MFDIVWCEGIEAAVFSVNAFTRCFRPSWDFASSICWFCFLYIGMCFDSDGFDMFWWVSSLVRLFRLISQEVEMWFCVEDFVLDGFMHFLGNIQFLPTKRYFCGYFPQRILAFWGFEKVSVSEFAEFADSLGELRRLEMIGVGKLWRRHFLRGTYQLIDPVEVVEDLIYCCFTWQFLKSSSCTNTPKTIYSRTGFLFFSEKIKRKAQVGCRTHDLSYTTT